MVTGWGTFLDLVAQLVGSDSHFFYSFHFFLIYLKKKMKNHITKTKGDIGVGYVIADLMSKDIQIALPISEHLPFDLIAIFQTGELKKVSVKYRTASDGTIAVVFKSNGWNTKRGLYSIPLNKDDVDFFAVYCPDNNKVYYFNHKKFNKAVLFRIYPPKNNQKKNIHYADDYLNVFDCI